MNCQLLPCTLVLAVASSASASAIRLNDSATKPAAPKVIAVSPAKGATEIATSTIVTATFSEAMKASTINTTTFTLTRLGGAKVEGKVSYKTAGSTASFAPAEKLNYNTEYTAVITVGVTSSTGVPLAA